MDSKKYFPVFLDLSEKKILVVGAGRIASRRVRSLLDFAGQIMVLAPEISEELTELAKEGRIRIEKRPYETRDLDGQDIVIVATTDAALNTEIGHACKKRGISVNTSHDRSLCDFYFPGLIVKENIVIGVTSSGTDHAKARQVTEKIRDVMDEMNG